MHAPVSVSRLFDIPSYQLQTYDLPAAFITKTSRGWESLPTREYVDQTNQMSRGLLKLGVQPNDKVAVIASTNRAEWNICDIGILQVGAQNVPLYPTISKEDYAYILNHSEACYCFVSDQEVLDKLNEIREETSLKGVFTFDEIANERNWQEVLKLGEDASEQPQVEALKATIAADDVATIIYTSGTTGKPKGVMLSHDNLVSNVLALGKRLPLTHGKDTALSFLPLCHVFERMVIYLYQYSGISVTYAESQEKLIDNVNQAKPQIMTSVPRLYEKVYERILQRGQALSGVKRRLFYWAVNLGLRYEPYRANGWGYALQLGIARKLIFSKWRKALGGNMKIMVSGGAALEPNLLRIFAAAGLPIMEGYGLTETSPVIAVNDIQHGGFNIGTVGRVIEQVEVKIADNGEVLVKGPNVMKGYYKDEAKTAEVFTERYFHTGDIGEVDADGLLRITGRIKEIFKTSGGKYVAPTKIENLLKQSSFIEQAMVVGEGEKMPAVIIQPNFEFVADWASQQGIAHTEPKELVGNPALREKMQEEISQINAQLGQWEQVKRFEMTDEVWSIADGQLTAKMSMKREAILERYADLYRKLYAEHA
ncbi:MAG: long-chain fatty acid--CoA ligase [Bacteroidota bacterium]